MKLASSVTMPQQSFCQEQICALDPAFHAHAPLRNCAQRVSLSQRRCGHFPPKVQKQIFEFFEEMEIFRKQLPPGKRAFSLFLSLRGNLLSQKLYFGGYEREGGACMKALQNLGKWQD